MRFLTVRELTTALQVSDSTVRRWVRDGVLRAYKVGKRGQLRFSEEDVSSFLETQVAKSEEVADGDPEESG